MGYSVFRPLSGHPLGGAIFSWRGDLKDWGGKGSLKKHGFQGGAFR